MSLRIGPRRVAVPLVLAPMAGVTDKPFRLPCRRLGAGLAVSEMTTAGAKVLVCQFESRLEATREALLAARDAGVTTILKPAPMNHGPDGVLLALPDIVTPTESESAFLPDHVHSQPLASNWLDFPDPRCTRCAVGSTRRQW